MKYENRKEKTLEVLNILTKTNLDYKLKDANTSQINIYLNDNQLIVYYVMKRTMYYKKNSKENILSNTFYDIKLENVGIMEVISFAIDGLNKKEVDNMNNLKSKIEELKKLEYSIIALDITNLDKTELETLIGRSIFKETKYLSFIAKKGIEKAHQETSIDNEVIDYIIKLK
jgi:hypothetical protein